jgi:hypothetical protein
VVVPAAAPFAEVDADGADVDDLPASKEANTKTLVSSLHHSMACD